MTSNRGLPATKLHIGSGDVALDGWTNIDLLPYPNVDRIADVTKGLPHDDARYVYAEHFIEHLAPEDAVSFVRSVRGALRDEGVFRLSTPNLDWAWTVLYHAGGWPSDDDAVQGCMNLNRSFRAWGHQFLYNRETLEALLRHCGFANVVFCEYGESEHEELRGLERHPRDPDGPGLPHVLIAEASGVAPTGIGGFFEGELSAYRRDERMPFHMLQYAALWMTRALKRLVGLRGD